jgi:hypothetical protein
MKSVIIGGVTRSGKSILAGRIREKTNLNVIPVDAIVVSLMAAFPEVGVNWSDFDASRQKLSPFLRVLICKLSLRSGYSYVYEGDHLTPELLCGLGPDYPILETNVPLFLGYDSISVQDKMQHLRAFSANHLCYTKNMSDAELIKTFEKQIADSVLLKQRCLELGFAYFDTSVDFNGAIDRACEFVCRHVTAH